MAAKQNEVESVTVNSPMPNESVWLAYRGSMFVLPREFTVLVQTTLWDIKVTFSVSTEPTGPLAVAKEVHVVQRGNVAPISLREVERVIQQVKPDAIRKAIWPGDGEIDSHGRRIRFTVGSDSDADKHLVPDRPTDVVAVVDMFSKRRGMRPATNDKVAETVRLFRESASAGEGLMRRYQMVARQLQLTTKTVERRLNIAKERGLLTSDERKGK